MQTKKPTKKSFKKEWQIVRMIMIESNLFSTKNDRDFVVDWVTESIEVLKIERSFYHDDLCTQRLYDDY